jgi:hypothetical protein
MTVASDYMRRDGQNPPEPLTAEHFQKWIDDYLKPRDPRPSHEALGIIAKHLNLIAERPGGAGSPILEEQALRFKAMLDSAEKYRADLAYYLEFDPSGGFAEAFAGFVRADRELGVAGLPPARQPTPPSKGKRGRPKSQWHSSGHRFADKFIPEVKKAGYRGPRGKKDPESITAEVGAKYISHIFQINLGPAGFASGLKERPRREWDRLTLDERFPEMAHIRNLDK